MGGSGPEAENIDTPVVLLRDGIDGSADAVPWHGVLRGTGFDGRDESVGDLLVDV